MLLFLGLRELRMGRSELFPGSQELFLPFTCFELPARCRSCPDARARAMAIPALHPPRTRTPCFIPIAGVLVRAGSRGPRQDDRPARVLGLRGFVDDLLEQRVAVIAFNNRWLRAS